jgi:hypothetical protein
MGSGISTSSIGATPGAIADVLLSVKGLVFFLCDPWRALILETATLSWSLRDSVFDLEIPSIRPLASLLPCAAAWPKIRMQKTVEPPDNYLCIPPLSFLQVGLNEHTNFVEVTLQGPSISGSQRIKYS